MGFRFQLKTVIGHYTHALGRVLYIVKHPVSVVGRRHPADRHVLSGYNQLLPIKPELPASLPANLQERERDKMKQSYGLVSGPYRGGHIVGRCLCTYFRNIRQRASPMTSDRWKVARAGRYADPSGRAGAQKKSRPRG